MKFVDLRSDTVTQPCEGMREAMCRAKVGDDGYGEDPTVRELEETAAGLCGKEAALFVPSGTMANQIALGVLAGRGEEVVCEARAHLYRKEGAAASVIWGLSFLPLPGQEGLLDAGRISRELPLPKINHPEVRVIALENSTASRGTCYPLAQAAQIHETARETGLWVHMDGARLFNACQAYGYSPAQIGRYCDTLSFCLSKGLGAPVGSLLVSSRGLIEKGRRLRKMLGGGLRQAGILAAAGLFALEHNRSRLAADHCRARNLARGLSRIAGVTIDPEAVETNILTFEVDPGIMPVDHLIGEARQRGLLLKSAGKSSIRAVTHMDVADDDIACAVSVIDQILGSRP